MHYIGGAGYFDGRNRCLGPNWSTAVKTDEHGLALHDATHMFADIGKGLVTEFFFGQGRNLFTFVGNIKSLVDHASLVFRQIKMNGVPGDGQC